MFYSQTEDKDEKLWEVQRKVTMLKRKVNYILYQSNPRFMFYKLHGQAEIFSFTYRFLFLNLMLTTMFTFS